jgi:hypothetical protein
MPGKKRPRTYKKPLELKKTVEFDDLLSVALRPPTEKTPSPKAKRAKGKKK